jgi:thiamine pyrophosphokinase
MAEDKSKIEKNVYSGKCIIVGAGDFFGLRRQPENCDFVIAADGGYSALAACGIIPDILAGDFDSLTAKVIPGEHTEVIRFPKEKDDTDMMLAVKEGLARGYKSFELYGGTGGRIDHFLANLQTLGYISRCGAEGRLFGGDYTAAAVTSGRLCFSARRSTIVSVFALGGTAEGVTLSGLKYPLSNATLQPDFPLGVSNEASGGEACVEVKLGTLLVIIYD